MIIARIQGGLGNQLFIYAAARGIASKHNIPLKFDAISGSKRDFYRRGKSLLHHFNTKIETASPYQCYQNAFGRIRRVLSQNICNYLPFKYRFYIKESGKIKRFYAGLLNNKPIFDTYLDGYWQSEKYFKHIEADIRQELSIVTPHDAENIALAGKICNENAVCVHARRLHGVGNVANPQPHPSIKPLGMSYYVKAINFIVERIANPVFLCFCDYPSWLQENMKLNYPAVYVTHNTIEGESKNYEDLWLMSQCKHFIIADSSFSWWGAWLSPSLDKIVCVPEIALKRFNQDWILNDWHTVAV